MEATDDVQSRPYVECTTDAVLNFFHEAWEVEPSHTGAFLCCEPDEGHWGLKFMVRFLRRKENRVDHPAIMGRGQHDRNAYTGPCAPGARPPSFASGWSARLPQA
jgi:hypothetical protein